MKQAEAAATRSPLPPKQPTTHDDSFASRTAIPVDEFTIETRDYRHAGSCRVQEITYLHTDSADYVLHEGHVCSVNGGFFMSPRTTDFIRWILDENNLKSEYDRERAVAKWFADRGACMKRLCEEKHEGLDLRAPTSDGQAISEGQITRILVDAVDEADVAFACLNICDDLTPQARGALKTAWAKVQAAILVVRPHGADAEAIRTEPRTAYNQVRQSDLQPFEFLRSISLDGTPYADYEEDRVSAVEALDTKPSREVQK